MFNATYNKTLVSHWFCSIFGARFFSGVSLGEGIKYSCWTWNVSWCRFCGSKGQGVAGLTHLARHALDVLSRMERHDDASVKYLQRLRCRSYRNSMEFWAGGKGSRNVEYSPIGGYSHYSPMVVFKINVKWTHFWGLSTHQSLFQGCHPDDGSGEMGESLRLWLVIINIIKNIFYSHVSLLLMVKHSNLSSSIPISGLAGQKADPLIAAYPNLSHFLPEFVVDSYDHNCSWFRNSLFIIIHFPIWWSYQ